MNKICTSLEQSKKFIELGIDVNTADMHYYKNSFGDYIEGLYHSSDLKEGCELKGIEYIPAWSLSALLELIPPYLGEFGEGIDFGFGKAMNGKWYSAHYLQYFQNGDVDSVKTVTGDTAVDAVFEMVVWLKENNKI